MFSDLVKEWENQITAATRETLRRVCLADGITITELRDAASELERLRDVLTFESRELATLIALGLRAKASLL